VCGGGVVIITMGNNKNVTELIIEAKQKSTLDKINLAEPYLWLSDKKFDRLAQAINIIAKEKGYRVVNYSVDPMHKSMIVLMEKKKREKEGLIT
jgi:hypothetical protein